jgi:hypothetical protein
MPDGFPRYTAVCSVHSFDHKVLHRLGCHLNYNNLAEEDGLSRVIKVCSMISFGGEVKPSVSRHEILWHVKKPCKY